MNSERIIRQLNRLNSFLRFDFSKLSDFQSQQNEAIHTLQQQNEMLRQQVDQLTSSINMLHETASKRFNLYAGIYNPELSTLSQILSDKQYNILICGYYGAPNLGDELMLQTLLDFFGYYKDIHVTVIIHDNQYLNESVYGKVSILHYPKTRFDFGILSQMYDAVVFGGGAVLDDIGYNYYIPYEQTLGQIIIGLGKAFIAQNKKVYAIGLSSNGSYSNSLYIQDLEKVINGSDFFSLRDKYSLTVLKKCGISISKIQLIPDIVCANEKLLYFPDQADNKESNIRRIGIIWAHFTETENYFDSLISKICYQCMVDEVNLIPFLSAENWDKDFYKKAISNINNKTNIHVLEPVWRMEDVISLFVEQDLIINMRYHGALLAGLLDVPCINIWHDEHRHYINKMKFIQDEFPQMENVLLSCFNLDSIIHYVDSMMKEKKERSPQKEKMRRSHEEINRIINNLHKAIQAERSEE